MAAFTGKVQFLLTDGRFSSVETYYNMKAANLTDLADAALTLAPLRAALMGPPQSNGEIGAPTSYPQFGGIKISNAATPRNFRLVPLPIFKTFAKKDNGDNAYADVEWDCVQIKYNAQDLYHSTRYLFATPDDFIIDDLFVPSGSWSKSFKALRTELLASWGLYAIDRTAGGLNNAQQITAVATVAGVVQFSANLNNLGAVQGETIKLSGFKQNQPSNWGINGSNYQINIITPGVNGVFSVTPQPPSPIYTIKKLGMVNTQRKKGFALTDVVTGQPGHRKRGGRAGLPLGRSKRR